MVQITYQSPLPAICVVMQLHHCTTVTLQGGIVLTFSIHIPHHYRKTKENKFYQSVLTKVSQMCWME